MAAAKHFTKQDYQPCSDAGPGKDLKGRLNAQIAHPSYSRTSKDYEKLSGKDRGTLMSFIEDELVRFSKAMKDTYKSHWPADMTPASRDDTDRRVHVLGPAGATAQIGTIGPTGPTGPVGPASSGTFTYSTDPAAKPT